MSTNSDSTIILSRTKDSQQQPRSLTVYERNNTVNTYNSVKSPSVKYLAHTYTAFYIEHKYLNEPFRYVDIVVTNRFTMESYEKRQLVANPSSPTSDFLTDSNASSYIVSVNTSKKINEVTLYLSMTDLMFGDVYLVFYDTPNKQDEFDAPIIFQFTNGPTVIAGNLYKWHPHNNVQKADPDNVFNDNFGAFWDWDAGKRGTEDTGRTDVLQADPFAGYSEVYPFYRLMTNGIRDMESTPMSLSGHPVYIAHYDTFIPKAFASAFGVNHNASTVRFSAVPLHQDELGAKCCSYLTNVDNFSTSASADDAFQIRIVEVDEGDVEDTMPAVEYDGTTASITGRRQRFNSYIGCLTQADANGNGVSFDNRKSDAWFRRHTMLHADFALTGLDPYWTGESNELPYLETERRYYVFDNVAYTPNVFELSWFAAGKGTSYYLVKKCPTGYSRTTWINNNENWIQVFTKENRPAYLLSDKTICADSKTVMCKEGDPVVSQSTNGVKYITDPSQCIYDNIEDIELDSNGHPLVVYENYFTYGVLHGGYWFSDNSTVTGNYTAGAWFRIMDETTDGRLHAVVYRVSDNGDSDSHFELSDADAEFVIIYRV